MNDEQFQSAAGEPGNKAAGQNGGTTALRIFDQANGMNDFPVLKAFQEYIEAEQARARKRTLGLSIFFIVLLVVVVVTFSVIMAAVINRDQQSLQAIATRNQALSDKLLDIALRERTPAAQPVVNVQQPPAAVHPDTGAQALKPVLDRLESLTEALKKQPAGTAPQPVPMVQPAAGEEEGDTDRPSQAAARRRCAGEAPGRGTAVRSGSRREAQACRPAQARGQARTCGDAAQAEGRRGPGGRSQDGEADQLLRRGRGRAEAGVDIHQDPFPWCGPTGRDGARPFHWFAPTGRDGARPSHTSSFAPSGRDGLCPVRTHEGLATASEEAALRADRSAERGYEGRRGDSLAHRTAGGRGEIKRSPTRSGFNTLVSLKIRS